MTIGARHRLEVRRAHEVLPGPEQVSLFHFDGFAPTPRGQEIRRQIDSLLDVEVERFSQQLPWNVVPLEIYDELSREGLARLHQQREPWLRAAARPHEAGGE